MIQRGRPRKDAAPKPATAKLVTPEFGARPEPPDDLMEAEVKIWQATVTTEDPAFFKTGAQRAMLSDYCRHRAAADKITRILNMFQDDWLKNSEGAKRYALLLGTRDKETRAAAGMATKLRMTNQSRYTPQLAGRIGRDTNSGGMPWDDLG